MTPVDADGEWVDLIEDEWLKGVFLNYQEGVGEHGSRMYKVLLSSPYGELERGETALFWGASNLNNQIDRGGVGRGRIVAIRKTSETFTTEDDFTGVVYDVRGLAAREA